MPRVVISGIGVVSPFGVGRERFWRHVSRGCSGTRAIEAFDASSLPCRVAAPVPPVSFDEAGRGTEGGHTVEGVAMPPEIFAWVGEYVERNYRPEPKVRIKPRSFIHPKDRV